MTDSWRRLAEFGAASICEAQNRTGIVDRAIAPLYRPLSLIGPAYPVAAPGGDILSIHLAIAEAPAGAVLVVNCGSHTEHACIGDVMTVAAQARGIAGLVTDGVVRDSRQIQTLGFAVFCRGTQIRGPTRDHPGQRNVPVVLGGVLVVPGDIVVGDDDGLVVVPAGTAAAVADKAAARESGEQEVMDQLRSGKTTVELFGLSAVADDPG